jgi:hypothetical protein
VLRHRQDQAAGTGTAPIGTAAARAVRASSFTPPWKRHRRGCSLRSAGVRLVPAPAGRGHFQVLSVTGSSTMAMQSTGQGATHSSQPVHSLAITVCICLPAPRIASTGQAWMQRVQPMHSGSSMTATVRGLSLAALRVQRLGSRSSRSASARMAASPPGGQRLMSASPAAMASA